MGTQHRGRLPGLQRVSLDRGAAFEKVAALIDAPAYSDRQVEAGKRYRYAVASVDQAGNESARTEAVEVTAQ